MSQVFKMQICENRYLNYQLIPITHWRNNAYNEEWGDNPNHKMYASHIFGYHHTKLFEKEVTYEKAKCTPYELNPLMVAFHLRGLQYCHPALWLVRASQSLPFSCKGATDLTGAVCSGHSVSTHCFSCRLCCHYGIDL